jgi:hypothetical protein
MQISDQDNQRLHRKLPIDANEKILAIYRHHWFAYASSWILGGIIVVVVMAVCIALATMGGDTGGLAAHKGAIVGAGATLSVLVLIGSYVPVYLRSQEQLVLTEEALLQVLQPSLFASKVDQVSLQRIDDVSVRQDFLGTIFGYGHLTIETPGEQDNYEFLMLPTPHDAARDISQAHENFVAALESGRLKTTLGEPRPAQVAAPGQPPIDPQQYQEFLKYQQMVEQQEQEEQGAQPPADSGQPPAGP